MSNELKAAMFRLSGRAKHKATLCRSLFLKLWSIDASDEKMQEKRSIILQFLSSCERAYIIREHELSKESNEYRT